MPAATDEAFKLGDFSKPVVPTTKDMLDSAEKQLVTEAKAVEAELRPMATYEERLKEVGVTRDEAARIIDAVISKGFWSEEMSLTKSIKIRLRTRSLRDTKRAQNHLENQRPVYDAHYQEIMTRFLLASSLEACGQEKFEHPPRTAASDLVEKSFADRLIWVESAGDPLYRLLTTKLAKFDYKISIVLEEGAIENF